MADLGVLLGDLDVGVGVGARQVVEQQAMGMIVNGFIEPITRTLPMEYAVEWSRLIELQMEGSVG